MEDRRGAYRVLVGRSEGMSPLGTPNPRWENNIKWIFKNWDGEVWSGLIWLRIGTGGGRGNGTLLHGVV
jgi:hypothetical protein